MSIIPEQRPETDGVLQRAQERVDDQILAIERMRKEGRSTLSAERLLETYREVLAALVN